MQKNWSLKLKCDILLASLISWTIQNKETDFSEYF